MELTTGRLVMTETRATTRVREVTGNLPEIGFFSSPLLSPEPENVILYLGNQIIVVWPA
jgi:hypothetical protein